MSNLTKIHLANWAKMVVVNGGTDPSIEVGPVLEHSSFTDEIGTSKSFHYVIRAVSDAPIEAGVAHMTSSTVMLREVVTNQMIDGEYLSGADLDPMDIPEGAFVFAAPTKEMLHDFSIEMPMANYTWDGVANSYTISPLEKHIHMDVGAALTTITFDPTKKPAAGTKHEFTISLAAFERAAGNVQPKVRFSGASFEFGNGAKIPDYPVITRKTIEQLPIGLINGSTYQLGKNIVELISLVTATSTSLTEGVNFSINYNTGLLTVLDIASSVQPWTITYKNPNRTILRFSSDDGGLRYLVENITEYLEINDLGSIDDTLDFDVRHPFNYGELTGVNATFNVDNVTPEMPVLHPAHFEFVNKSGIEKTVIFDTDFFDIIEESFPGFIIVPDGKKFEFDIRRNADQTSVKKYSIKNLQREIFVRDLGVLSTPVTLDIRHRWNIGEFTGSGTSVLIEGVSPDVPLAPMLEPAHFTFVNNGSVTKTVIWGTELFSISGSTLGQVTLPVGYKLDFDVRRNPLNETLSYEVKVGDVNYNQTASGLATTWNPSNSNPNLDFSNNNKTVTFDTAVGSTGVVFSGRAFGAKSSGKFRIACVVPTLPNGATSSVTSTLILGVADYTLSLTSDVGSTLSSAGVRIHASASSTRTIGKINNNVLTAYPSPPALDSGLILGVLVDLDSGKIWFTINNIVLSGGDPVAGTGADFTMVDTILLPALTLRALDNGTGSPTIAVITLLNEVEDPYASFFSTFPTWTA